MVSDASTCGPCTCQLLQACNAAADAHKVLLGVLWLKVQRLTLWAKHALPYLEASVPSARECREAPSLAFPDAWQVHSVASTCALLHLCACPQVVYQRAGAAHPGSIWRVAVREAGDAGDPAEPAAQPAGSGAADSGRTDGSGASDDHAAQQAGPAGPWGGVQPAQRGRTCVRDAACLLKGDPHVFRALASLLRGSLACVRAAATGACWRL
jgi:hypothetical protein